MKLALNIKLLFPNADFLLTLQWSGPDAMKLHTHMAKVLHCTLGFFVGYRGLSAFCWLLRAEIAHLSTASNHYVAPHVCFRSVFFLSLSTREMMNCMKYGALSHRHLSFGLFIFGRKHRNSSHYSGVLQPATNRTKQEPL